MKSFLATLIRIEINSNQKIELPGAAHLCVNPEKNI